jgi:hypothetical protein
VKVITNCFLHFGTVVHFFPQNSLLLPIGPGVGVPAVTDTSALALPSASTDGVAS